MRVLWLSLFLAGLSVIGNPHQGPDPCLFGSDPYSVGNIMNALRICRNGTAALPSIENGIAFLGDAASIGVLKLWDSQELAKPENTKSYLCLVRIAFHNSAMIGRKADKSPNVTAFLLDYLEEKNSNSAQVENEIASVRKYIQERATP